MKAAMISCAVLLATPFAAAEGLQKASKEEVLQASMAALQNSGATYEPSVEMVTDPSTGDTLQKYTFTGPSDDMDAILGACNIAHEAELGIRETANGMTVRRSALTDQACGGATVSPMRLSQSEVLTISFHVQELSLQ